MFVIKNISDNDVVLDDLRLVLGPNREIDLDKVASRSLTDYSSKLRLAIHQQRVRVVVKDPDRNVPGNPAPSLDKAVLADMEDRIKADFAVQLSKKDDQINQLTAAIHQLVTQLQKQPAQVVQVVHSGGPVAESTTSDTGSSPSDISDDIASSIHAKAMARMEKNVVGNIDHEAETVKDDHLQNNITELEGLL